MHIACRNTIPLFINLFNTKRIMNKYYYNFLSSSRDKILFLCVIMSVTGISQARIKSNRLFKLSRSRVSQECHFLRFSTRAVMCHRDTVHGRYIAQLLGYPLLIIQGRESSNFPTLDQNTSCYKYIAKINTF